MTAEPHDPNRSANWIARFLTSDGHLIDEVRYQSMTSSQAHDLAEERAQSFGSRCDDYAITEESR